MLRLKNIDILEFKQIVYQEYIKLFPASERKPYKMLEDTYKRGILKIIKIEDDNKFVGFILANSLEEKNLLQVDYFAILPEYQSKGYGTKAFKLLKSVSTQYYGIFIEVEKEGLGKDVFENELRIRRIEFYKRIGFVKLNFDLDLFKVIFSPYILYLDNKIKDEEKIIQDITQMYFEMIGKKRFEKNCRIIRGDKNEKVKCNNCI